jgi:MFS family permease
MFRSALSKKIGINPNLALKSMVVLAGAFIWYFLAFSVIEGLMYSLKATDFQRLEVLGANCFGTAISAILASLVVDKLRKRNIFLTLWTVAGIFLSFLPTFLPLSSISELIAVSTIFGVYFGLGMPSAMGYFSTSTNPGNRAALGGVTFLVIGLSFFILGNVGIENMVVAGSVLAALRLTSLLLFLSLKVEDKHNQDLRIVTYKSIAANRSFILYFIPWIMFNVVNYLTYPALADIASNIVPENMVENFVRISGVFENLLIAVLAIVTGFLADKKGRKRLAILGFAILGMGFASLSFFQNIYGWSFYTIVDGIAWGILDVIFLFTLWGDIGQGYNSEKLYVLGALPYLFSFFLRLLVVPLVSNLGSQIFTFASFFLFLAVLPLVYAPETLPEKIIRKNELEVYVAKAQEIAQKHS